MTNIIDDLMDFISDIWETLRDKDKRVPIKAFSALACIATDFFYAILDIFDTWKAKDEKIIAKILCTISTIIFLFIGIRFWLNLL